MLDFSSDKGSFNYIRRLKRKTFIIAFTLYLLSITLFIIGIVTTGSKKNYLSIAAAIGILPAAKFTVWFIMAHTFIPISPEEYKKISNIFDSAVFYDLLLTNNTLVVNINALIVSNGCIYAFSKTNKNKAIKATESELSQLLSAKVQLYDNIDDFLAHTVGINNRQEDNDLVVKIKSMSL